MKSSSFPLALIVLAGLLLNLLLNSCQQDYDVQLPPYESKLVLECYLEDGQPLRLTLLESRSYQEAAELPLVNGATVVLKHLDQQEVIPNFPYVDRRTGKAYNYSSNTIIQADYEAPYTIEVRDLTGRVLTASTRFIRSVPIKSITPEFNAKSEAYALTKFDDQAGETNFYRLTLTRNARVDTLALSALLDDAFRNGQEINWGSGYDFLPGDTIHATLYHCTPEYYKYLSTVQSARAANVNPFAASGEVVSNVKGGLGIFATLNYDYQRVVVR